MRNIVLTLLIYGSVATPSLAATFASGSSFDSRMQTVMYNPDDVVKVRVKPGTVSVVQVSSDEKIEDVGLGDPAAWNVQVRNNTIFFRPASDDNPDTNVVLVTDKRAYTLFLTSVKSDPTFVLRFEYPKSKPILFDNNKISCTDGGQVNGRYQVQGDESIKPNKIWDDGRFTCFIWEDNKTMPVVYRVDADGNENIVNTNMEKNVMVVHDVSPEFILRNGNQVMRVKTTSIVKRLYDTKGTTTGQRRVEKVTDE